jgi:hypothetical protein
VLLYHIHFLKYDHGTVRLQLGYDIIVLPIIYDIYTATSMVFRIAEDAHEGAEAVKTQQMEFWRLL